MTQTKPIAIELKRLKKRILINDIFIIIFLGFVLNMGVIIYNDSRMPVYFYEGEGIPEVDDSYLPFTDFDEVNYPYLSDIFKISRLKFSLGDILIVGGGISVIIVYFK